MRPTRPPAADWLPSIWCPMAANKVPSNGSGPVSNMDRASGRMPPVVWRAAAGYDGGARRFASRSRPARVRWTATHLFLRRARGLRCRRTAFARSRVPTGGARRGPQWRRSEGAGSRRRCGAGRPGLTPAPPRRARGTVFSSAKQNGAGTGRKIERSIRGVAAPLAALLCAVGRCSGSDGGGSSSCGRALPWANHLEGSYS